MIALGEDKRRNDIKSIGKERVSGDRKVLSNSIPGKGITKKYDLIPDRWVFPRYFKNFLHSLVSVLL